MNIKFFAPIFVRTDDADIDYSKEYYSDILNAVEDSMDNETPKGLIEYASDELIEKYCKSAIVSIRVTKDDELESVCVCELEGIDKNHPDFDRLVSLLEDEITGQYSDGWGEGFEQRPIRVNNFGSREEIYVSFWSPDDWEMKHEINC